MKKLSDLQDVLDTKKNIWDIYEQTTLVKYEEFKIDMEQAGTPSLVVPYDVWVSSNDKKYDVLRSGWQTAAAQVLSLKRKLYGHSYVQIFKDLIAAQDSKKFTAGYVSAWNFEPTNPY